MAEAAPRHADDHRHAAAPAIANLGGVVDELVEAGRHEVVELHLADRPQAGERSAHARAEHGALRERRVHDAVAVGLEQRPQQQKRVAVLTADVFAEHERPRIGRQRVADAEHHRVEERLALRDRRAARPQSPTSAVRQAPAVAVEHLDAPAVDRIDREHAAGHLRSIRPAGANHRLRLGLDHGFSVALHPIEIAGGDQPARFEDLAHMRESDRASRQKA